MIQKGYAYSKGENQVYRRIQNQPRRHRVSRGANSAAFRADKEIAPPFKEVSQGFFLKEGALEAGCPAQNPAGIPERGKPQKVSGIYKEKRIEEIIANESQK